MGEVISDRLGAFPDDGDGDLEFGGRGSGHHDHKGRKGHRGGSAPEEGPGLSDRQLEAFRDRAYLHTKFFATAAKYLNRALGVEFGRIPDREIENHDRSKFERDELYGYAVRFYGKREEYDKWEAANASHIAKNLHHPEHWVEAEGEPKPMPSHWCLAMVADWMGSSRQYTGSLDMTKFLDSHFGAEPRWPMHSDTVKITTAILARLGYERREGGEWAWTKRDWVGDVIDYFRKLEHHSRHR